MLRSHLISRTLIGFAVGWLAPVACAVAQVVPRSHDDWIGLQYVALILLFPAGGLGALLGFGVGLVSGRSD